MTGHAPPPVGDARLRAGLVGAPLRVDLLVVGLGVTGAGVALDAASRGLTVLAVDAHDVAFGTSRWSSKLVHGGLRYLAHGQVGGGPRERRRARDPDGDDRPAPDPRPADAAAPDLRRLLRPGRARLGRAAGRRPAPGRRPHQRRPRSPAPAGSPARRPCGSRRRCAAPGCAAGCSAGTASSRTTPGWSPAWPAPRRRTARTCAPAPGCCPLTGSGGTLRDELTGATHEVHARGVVNATGRVGGLAGGLRAAEALARHPPRAAVRQPPRAGGGADRARPGDHEPLRVRAPPARRHRLRRPDRRGDRRRGARRAAADRARDRLPARRRGGRPGAPAAAYGRGRAPSPGSDRCWTPTARPPTCPAGTPCSPPPRGS